MTVGAPYLVASSSSIYFEIEIDEISLSGRIFAGFAGTNFQDAKGRAPAFQEGLGFDSLSWSVDSSDGTGCYRLVNLPCGHFTIQNFTNILSGYFSIL